MTTFREVINMTAESVFAIYNPEIKTERKCLEILGIAVPANGSVVVLFKDGHCLANLVFETITENTAIAVIETIVRTDDSSSYAVTCLLNYFVGYCLSFRNVKSIRVLIPRKAKDIVEDFKRLDFWVSGHKPKNGVCCVELTRSL